MSHGPVYTTQQTSKKWKGLQGCGCLLCVIGLVGVGLGVAAIDRARNEAPSPVIAYAGLAFFAGLGMYATGRVGGWWFHG